MTVSIKDEIAQPTTSGQVESALREFLSIWGEPSDKEVKEWCEAFRGKGKPFVYSAAAAWLTLMKPSPAEVVSAGSSASMKRCVIRAAKKHSIDPQDILGGVRIRPVAYARFEAMYECRKLGFSYPQIGAYLNRDHTSIMHGIRRHKDMNGIK